MPDSKKIYESLFANGFSKEEIDGALHSFTLLRLKEKKKPSYNIPPVLYSCLKHFPVLNHITAKGLYLLKTQFAKKPKNPV